MKLSISLLALCALQQASAFNVQTQKPTKTLSSLNSSPNGDMGVSDRVRVNGNSMGRSGLSRSPDRRGPPIENSRQQQGPVTPITEIWNSLSPETVQGGSLRTWSFASPAVERVQVLMKTDGRPLNANVELWQGPDNSPQKMDVYVEDGSIRTFSAVIETPRGSNAVAIRNTGVLEFPLSACVDVDNGYAGIGSVANTNAMISPRTIQGGAVHTYPFAPAVESVQVVLTTDGRPLNARIELLQGPNNNKQVVELYTEDGTERPFCAVIETPGSGNVVRIVNTATVEFPLTASVEPYSVDGSW